MSRKPKNLQRRKLIRLGSVLALLLGPLLVPITSSGTQTYKQAAGANANFFKSLGINIHYEMTPIHAMCIVPGKLIVLLHGFGASTFSWQPIQQSFSPCDTVISYDRPAFGFTERPLSWKGVNPYSMAGQMQILDDLISQFGGGKQAVLVGHSAGGQVAAEYARLNPFKVSKLVLESPAILNKTPGDGLAWLTYIPEINHIGPALVSTIASSGDDLIRKSFHDVNKLTAATFAGYHAPLKIENWEFAFWEFARADKANEVEDNLDDLKMPVLIITGDDDRVVETHLTQHLAKMTPDAKLVIVPNAGHLLHEEDPAAFMQAVGDFIG